MYKETLCVHVVHVIIVLFVELNEKYMLYKWYRSTRWRSTGDAVAHDVTWKMNTYIFIAYIYMNYTKQADKQTSEQHEHNVLPQTDWTRPIVMVRYVCKILYSWFIINNHVCYLITNISIHDLWWLRRWWWRRWQWWWRWRWYWFIYSPPVHQLWIELFIIQLLWER